MEEKNIIALTLKYHSSRATVIPFCESVLNGRLQNAVGIKYKSLGEFTERRKGRGNIFIHFLHFCTIHFLNICFAELRRKLRNNLKFHFEDRSEAPYT